jgi:hypothetical protein
VGLERKPISPPSEAVYFFLASPAFDLAVPRTWKNSQGTSMFLVLVGAHLLGSVLSLFSEFSGSLLNLGGKAVLQKQYCQTSR